MRAWARLGSAQLANEHGDGAAEQAEATAALAEFRRLGDLDGELAACEVLSAMCLADGRPREAREFSEAALAVATRTGRPRDAAQAQANLTCHDVYAADLPSARRRLATVDRMAARSGQERLRTLAAAALAEVARLQGRCEEAVAIGRRASTRLAEVGDAGHRRRALGTVGQALAALGRVADAEDVLRDLRSAAADAGSPGGRALCAGIEARLALVRGDRVGAAEWFAAAAEDFQRAGRRRGQVEALVGLAACITAADRRDRVLAELDRVVQHTGVVLLPTERDALTAAPAS